MLVLLRTGRADSQEAKMYDVPTFCTLSSPVMKGKVIVHLLQASNNEMHESRVVRSLDCQARD